MSPEHHPYGAFHSSQALREAQSLYNAINTLPSLKHSHYFKSVAHLKTIDVYRVLSVFEVTDPCLQHAIKKLLVAGGRGAGKSIEKDVQEAIDTLVRWQAMRAEDDQRAVL